jgi:hypothetical protein
MLKVYICLNIKGLLGYEFKVNNGMSYHKKWK